MGIVAQMRATDAFKSPGGRLLAASYLNTRYFSAQASFKWRLRFFIPYDRRGRVDKFHRIWCESRMLSGVPQIDSRLFVSLRASHRSTRDLSMQMQSISKVSVYRDLIRRMDDARREWKKSWLRPHVVQKKPLRLEHTQLAVRPGVEIKGASLADKNLDSPDQAA